MSLTKFDEITIANLPKGWFTPLDFPKDIERAEYRCARLESMGILKSRISKHKPYIRAEYHIIGNKKLNK